MGLIRAMVYGGSIGGIAAWVHVATEGLLSAAALVVGSFALLIVFGLSLAVVTEDIGPRPWASAIATVRRVRHRRSLHLACGVCARVIINLGSVRVCATCDRIPVAHVSMT